MTNVSPLYYDFIVLGAGSGGYAAARTARDLGASVALVDRGPLGGLCILRGCMPSKTLLASSDLAHDIRESKALGVTGGSPTLDMPFINARKREVIAGFADYRIEGLQSFPIYDGAARFITPTQIEVGETILEGKNFVVGTGSSVAPAVVPGLDEVGYIDSDQLLDTDRLPKSAIVLGGGYVASELGQFLARAGVETTFVLRAPQLFSGEDSDVGEAVTAYFRLEGIRVETNARPLRVEKAGGLKRVIFVRDGGEHMVEAEEIFYALGRVPNVDGLGLDIAGVEHHAMTGIKIGPDMRTSNPHVFAVGDVTGLFPLVHVAIYQGEIAARNAILGTSEVADYSLQKTHTIFTDPQVAIVGETEKELTASGTPYLRGSYLFSEHGKAISINKTKGFVKMMADPISGKILGAACVGPEASDLIHEVIVAMWYGSTVQDFMRIPHLHPTLAEIWTYPAEDIAEQIATARAEAESASVAAAV
jgi:pyruvate/2-oxoglutarate dehydrogenase complex dihydrolipoamide dehydrogenase (E3) component